MNTAALKYFKRDFLKSKFAIYIAAVGLLLFILASSTVNFKDSIFSKIFPKPYSQAADPNDWAQVQKDPQRSGYSDEILGTTFKVKWAYSFPPERVHPQVQAIIYSNSVYVGTEAGNLYAIDASTGAKRWSFQAGGSIVNSVAADNGKVYFGAMDGAVYAVDTTSGSQVWKTQVSLKGISTAPVFAEGKIMLGGRDGYFFGLNETNGNLLWKYNAGAPIFMTAAYDSGKAFFGSMDMYVHAVNTVNGTGVWKSAKIKGVSFKSYWPVVKNGNVFIIPEAGTLAFSNTGTNGIAPNFSSGTLGSTWLTTNSQTIATGNLSSLPEVMKLQDDVMAKYTANPSSFTKVVNILDANTGLEPFAIPHSDGQTHNGSNTPPCIDKDGNLVLFYNFFGSKWGRVSLASKRLIDVLYDGTTGGSGNMDENMNVSCSRNIIFGMHMGENAANYTGAFDLINRKWTKIDNKFFTQQMTNNTQSGGGNPPSISNGILYHIVFNELIARTTK